MIQVCFEDGEVVCEFATLDEFKEGFPNGLDDDNIAAGFFVRIV